MSSVESTVQQRLGIKWVDAKRLVQDAARNCEINGLESTRNREEEVIEEACELFEDLDDAEKARMRISSPAVDNDSAAAAAGVEPAWKRKAREQAERREAEWQAKEAAAANNEKVREKLRAVGVPEEEIQGTKVTSIRKVEGPPPETASIEPGKGIVYIRTHTCLCVIL